MVGVATLNKHTAKGPGCWIWTGSRSTRGYGRVRDPELRRNIQAHRAAWESVNGPIPPGRFVCHRCDIRACVRPDHLFLGTARENTWDAMEKGRLAIGLRNRGAKLTPVTAEEIRRLYALGWAQRPIAAEFGVAQSTVHDVLVGHSWRTES